MIYKRYNEKNRLVLDVEKLKLDNDFCVQIYQGEGFLENDSLDKTYIDDVCIDLEECEKTFEELKSYIVFIAANLSDLDEIVQKYSEFLGEDNFWKDFYISYICIEENDNIRIIYNGNHVNTVLEVCFDYKDKDFVLRKYGSKII